MNYGDGWSPLWYCREYRRPVWKEAEVVLLQSGAVMQPLWSVAKCAAMNSLDEMCRLVEDGADVNSSYEGGYGYTALHTMAAVPGDGYCQDPEVAAEMIKWL